MLSGSESEKGDTVETVSPGNSGERDCSRSYRLSAG
jgi:hypothetical protein